MKDQEKVMMMVLVMKEESQSKHYFVVVFVDLAHPVQLNVDCVHQEPEKAEFKKAVVFVEFYFAPDPAAPVIVVDAPVIVFDVASAAVTEPSAVAPFEVVSAPAEPLFPCPFEAELASAASNISDVISL